MAKDSGGDGHERAKSSDFDPLTVFFCLILFSLCDFGGMAFYRGVLVYDKDEL